MSAPLLTGPFDGRAVRLWTAGPGRLVVDDLGAGAGPSVGAGWVEPAGISGGTALIRLSTAAVGSDKAVAELIGAVLDQARAAGAHQVVIEDDAEDRERALSAAMTRGDHLDVVVVPPFRVTNSLGRQLERVVTLQPGRVGIYSCGPTVYSHQHIGNMVPYVFADTLERALRWRGLDVHHIINITDVGHLLADADEGEDKVEEASRREGRTVDEITEHYTELFWRDITSLNVLAPDAWPRASAYVPQMISFAQVLQDHGYGYVLPGGLYFDTARQPDYGELAAIDVSGLREGARVEPVEGKRSKTDFALWRTFTDGRERLMQWDSPWGVGAPGWHLECSVMSMALLGEHFDIHTGGIDHRELHHVNEIAQSEAYLEDGRRWVRYWMHNEFLNLNKAKMSKSAGGTTVLADLVALGVHPLAYRYFLLSSHYASQMEFTEKLVVSAHVGLKRLAARLWVATGPAAEPGPASQPDAVTAGDTPVTALDEPITLIEALDEAVVLGSTPLRERLLAIDAAIVDDLMTPTVLALVNTWAKEPAALAAGEWRVLLRAINTLTGLSLGILGAADFVPVVPGSVDVALVEDLLADRDAARATRDWARADRVRAELSGAGVRVEDTPEGSHWYYAGPTTAS